MVRDLRHEYIKLIEAHDRILCSIGLLWLTAESDEQKQKLMASINEGLDERFRSMTLRDSA